MPEDFFSELSAVLLPLLGQQTTKTIEDFYQNSSREETISTAESLLGELFGPENARKHMQPIYEKFIQN